MYVPYIYISYLPLKWIRFLTIFRTSDTIIRVLRVFINYFALDFTGSENRNIIRQENINEMKMR